MVNIFTTLASFLKIGTFASTLSFLQNQSYFIILLLMFIEGPIVTAGAAFAASLGYLNIYTVLLLSLLGNQIPDVILFFIGRLGRKKFIEQAISKFGLSPSRIIKIENNFKKHLGKTLVFVKITPFLPLPGILLAGFMKVSIKKFFFITIVFNLVSALVATIIGFYFGLASSSIFKYLKIGDYVLLFVMPLVIFIYWLYKRASISISDRIKKND